jgi:hypothetical protein
VDCALETTAFHWIEHHHNPLKWHRTSYSGLFLNFGMQGICKMFTTKIGLVSLCRLSQRMAMGFSSTMNPNIQWLSLRSEFLTKEFSCERFKLELDEVIELEQDDQSSATPENVLEATTAFMAPAPTTCFSTRHQSFYLTKLVVIK